MKFKTLPILLLCLSTTGSFAESGIPDAEIAHRVVVPVMPETPEGTERLDTRVVSYRKAPGCDHILFKTDQVDKLTKLFSKVKIARTSEESAPAGAGSSLESTLGGMPDDSEAMTALNYFGPVVGGAPTVYGFFTAKMMSLFPCVPTEKSQANIYMAEINSMLIAQGLFAQGQTEFTAMGRMFSTILAQQGRTKALAAWANLDNVASPENLSSAPTLVTLTLYPGTSRQATVNISPKTLGWKLAYNVFAKAQTPNLPYSSSVLLVGGASYLVQDLVNALVAFTGGVAAVGSQLDILKAGFYQTSDMAWPGTMSSTFTAYLE